MSDSQDALRQQLAATRDDLLRTRAALYAVAALVVCSCGSADEHAPECARRRMQPILRQILKGA